MPFVKGHISLASIVLTMAGLLFGCTVKGSANPAYCTSDSDCLTGTCVDNFCTPEEEEDAGPDEVDASVDAGSADSGPGPVDSGLFDAGPFDAGPYDAGPPVDGGLCMSSCSGSTPDCCGSECVDFQNDDNNCGGCGKDCGAWLFGSRCEQGRCCTQTLFNGCVPDDE